MKENNFSTKCTIVVSDTHFQSPLNGRLVAPDFCHDPRAISTLLQVIKNRNPDEIIHIGDICEMSLVSRWQENSIREGQVKGNDGNWYKDSWTNSMNMVNSFWEYLRKINPKSQFHQLEGNHDFWSDVAFTHPRLSPFADKLAFRNLSVWKNCNIQYYPYNGDQKILQPWVDVGKVRVLHGYKNVNARRMRLEHDNVMYGHQHKILYDSWDANSREMRRAWSIGCLTKLKPDYNSRGGAQNGWAQAFGIIYTMPDGTFSVRVVEITDGKIVDFDGKPYYSKPLGDIDKSLECLDLP